ncbi:MAG: hypothetical protein PWP65_37 [Clostridia bacterium]|nr:hypothetical protein [Clostridia bacterium]
MEEVRHQIIVTGRKKLFIEGVTQVLNYDEKEIILETNSGLLILTGENFNIYNLSLEKGVLEVSGLLRALEYSEKSSGKGKNILQRLFK